MHGFALNVCGDLAPFAEITPCGISGVSMTSIEKENGKSVTVRDVAAMMEKLLPRQIDELRTAEAAHSLKGTV
jgi:lipoyl(octanoyl) transferase